MREQWGELNKFMARVKERYAGSQCILSTEKLLVDGRMFVWDRKSQKVEEQVIVTIPANGDVITSINAQMKTPSRIQLDDIDIKH